MKNIIIATIKEWNIENYFKLKEKYGHEFNFHLISNSEALTEEFIQKINPNYIFFLHWSWIIPKNIYNNFNCVLFHMTDLPYGRGGSPLQNLIMNKVYKTKISAIKVSENIDSGDIYLKESLDISTGSAQDIFKRSSQITFEKMIPEFLSSKLSAKEQSGEIVTFKRRTPEQSSIKTVKDLSLTSLYDFIRMLDGEGYPKAYIEIENIKIEFSQADKTDTQLRGKFEVKVQ
ncbi:MAG: methionyl-tRNA formyltransferase [Candidatus Marinimicrobia bacterium]|nr:methionyl-tRNA formyltransferase [Candidatus Neomarinimicrobiota bacterium]